MEQEVNGNNYQLKFQQTLTTVLEVAKEDLPRLKEAKRISGRNLRIHQKNVRNLSKKIKIDRHKTNQVMDAVQNVSESACLSCLYNEQEYLDMLVQPSVQELRKLQLEMSDLSAKLKVATDRRDTLKEEFYVRKRELHDCRMLIKVCKKNLRTLK